MGIFGGKDNVAEMLASLPKRSEGKNINVNDVPEDLVSRYYTGPRNIVSEDNNNVGGARTHRRFALKEVAARTFGRKTKDKLPKNNIQTAEERQTDHTPSSVKEPSSTQVKKPPTVNVREKNQQKIINENCPKFLAVNPNIRYSNEQLDTIFYYDKNFLTYEFNIEDRKEQDSFYMYLSKNNY